MVAYVAIDMAVYKLMNSSTLLNIIRDFEFGGAYWIVQIALARFSRKKIMPLKVPEYGEILIRPQNSDLNVVRQVMRDKAYHLPSSLYAAALDRAYRTALTEGRRPVIIDAGANIGASAIYFAKLFPLADIVAIEPDADNFALLKSNTKQIQQIKCLHMAIGGEGGMVKFGTNPLTDEGWGVVTIRENSVGVGAVPITTVADILSGYDRAKLLVAKIDIEGFESDLFRCNTEWVGHTAVIAVEPHDVFWPGKGITRSLQRVMGIADFELMISGETLFYVSPAIL